MQSLRRSAVWQCLSLACFAHLGLCEFSAHGVAADGDVPFSFTSGQTDQFGGGTCTLRIDDLPEGSPPRMGWRLITESREIERGVAELKPVEGSPRSALFDITTPTVLDGVVLEVSLTCQLQDAVEVVVLPVRLRGKNPFAAVREMLKKTGVALYDPVGTTAAALQDLEVAITLVSSLDKVDEEPLVMLGEGIEWSDRLTQRADELARLGKTIVVLRADTESTWTLPLSADGLVKCRFTQLDKSELIPKKLDVQTWISGTETSSGWELTINRSKLQLVPAIGPQSWAIAEYQTINEGRCLFVGVPLISRWGASPVSRELLAEIVLSHLNHLNAATAAETR